jgi:hypothetical protein
MVNRTPYGRAAAALCCCSALGAAACRGGGDAREDTVAVATVPAAASPAPAAAARGDGDLARLEEFRLTMPRVERWQKAMRNLGVAVRARPELRDKVKVSGTASLDEAVAAYEAVPEIRKAIGDAGLSVREFQMIMWTQLQAGMAQGVIGTGANRDSVLRAMRVHPSNVDFVKRHGAEIERRFQALQKEAKAKAKDGGGAE